MKNQFKERNHFYIRVGKEFVIPLLLILHDHDNFTDIQFHELVTVIQGILKNHFSKIRYSFYSTYLTSEQSSTSKPLYLKDIGFTFRFATTYPRYAIIVKNSLDSIHNNDLKKREEEKKRQLNSIGDGNGDDNGDDNDIILVQDKDNYNNIDNSNNKDNNNNNIDNSNSDNSNNIQIQNQENNIIDIENEKDSGSDNDYEEVDHDDDDEEIEKEFKLTTTTTKSKKKIPTKRNSNQKSTKKKESIKIDYNKQSVLSDPVEVIETKFDRKQYNEDSNNNNSTTTTTSTSPKIINIDNDNDSNNDNNNNNNDNETTSSPEDIYKGGLYHGLTVTGHTLIIQTQNKVEGTSRPIDLFYYSDEEDDGFNLPDSESQLSTTSTTSNVSSTSSNSKRVRKTTTTTTTTTTSSSSNSSRRKTKSTIATGNNSISTYFSNTGSKKK